MQKISRAIPAVLLALVGIWAWRSGAVDNLSWSSLAEHQAALRTAVADDPWEAGAIYIGVFVASALLCLPVGAVLKVSAGALFGAWTGGALAAVGATLGAVLSFLVVREATNAALARRLEQLTARLRPRLERDGFAALLSLRLLPMTPFWVMNVVPALIGMRLRPYVLSSALGITPVSFAFASAGAGLNGVLASGRTLDSSILLSMDVVMPIGMLCMLSTAPFVLRRLRAIPTK